MSTRLEKSNLLTLSNQIEETYKNFVVSDVNESCLRLAVIQGEYPWHCHPTSDELFIVLEGELFIDFQDQPTIALKANDQLTIPAGVIHRTRTEVRTVNLCFEHTDADTTFI
ncbi:cupin domain-containing protein [Paenibacillus sp. N1-5-1-14]|uniref:cupin domain-containing protein n=1 Tax=Paenibacillus radicibacter TaxID=2972488 RepID=UPI002158AFC5|nr:cupin domain-containing protein [Paenibacillus radicibacter]MCR8641255.1 cupin domain-containing protein [Paenibacillus radicibacter]